VIETLDVKLLTNDTHMKVRLYNQSDGRPSLFVEQVCEGPLIFDPFGNGFPEDPLGNLLFFVEPLGNLQFFSRPLEILADVGLLQ
jgi:hypothetical protein